MTTYGSYVLMDPDTKEELEGGPFPPERLICIEDCPFEDPINKEDPLWIHTKFNFKGSPQRWVLRRIAAESISGMHRLVGQDGEHDDIVDLSQHSWYFVYEPKADPKDEDPSSDARKVDPVEPYESTMVGTDRDVWSENEDDTQL